MSKQLHDCSGESEDLKRQMDSLNQDINAHLARVGQYRARELEKTAALAEALEKKERARMELAETLQQTRSELEEEAKR